MNGTQALKATKICLKDRNDVRKEEKNGKQKKEFDENK